MVRKIISYLRNYKFSYEIYNMFHKKQLAHNIPLFKKYHIKKHYYSSISSADFKDIQNNYERKEDTYLLKNTSFFQNQTIENQNSLLQYFDNGYAIVKNWLTEETVEKINKDIKKLMDDGKLTFSYRNKLMFAWKQSEIIKKVGFDKSTLELLNILIGGKATLFQSINFLSGSQQKTHSDSFHMTTFPFGGLIGIWVALEDIHLDNGPLHYYPGSHRLPYFMNGDYNNQGSKYKLGTNGYEGYEKMLADKVQKLNLEKQVFTCKKGDMLIWHANILHGGEPQLNPELTRKSMVFHYFDADSICYHEVTQRPALF